MTYPQMPQFPQQQPQGYPQPPVQQPQFPQQYVQPQGYPQQYGQPQMPPGYPPQAQAAPPAEPPPQGNLSDFYNQPSVSGGPSWTFRNKAIGTVYVGHVERPITNSDIEAQTIPGTNQLAKYRDGGQKWVMKVPMLQAQDAEHPEGKATWFVTGQARDELARAMAEAGAPEGPPEAGAYIGVQLTGRRESKTPGFNPSNQVRVVYQRPQGAPPVTPAAQPAPVAQQPAPVQQMPVPQVAPPVAPVVQQMPAQPVQQQLPVQMVPPPAPVQQAPVAPVVQQMPAPAAPAATPQQLMPANLDADQQALYAQLTGGQQPAA
jgi:hypothetical protein